MRSIQIQASITYKNEDSISRYFRELDDLKPLKPEEEFDLARRIKAGDKAALDKLVSANLRFVISIAKKHIRGNRSLGDLISEGNLGLIEAAQRFDETRGFRFVSYAVWWIRRSMLSGNGSLERMVRLPMNLVQGISDINTSGTVLLQELEREPTAAELAAHIGLSVEKVRDMLAVSWHIQSLDKPVDEESGHTLLDRIGDWDPLKRPDLVEGDSLRIEIRRVFRVLNAKEKMVLKALFGLGTGPPVEIGELAGQLGISKEGIRLIKLRALKKLGEVPYSKRLLEYL